MHFLISSLSLFHTLPLSHTLSHLSFFLSLPLSHSLALLIPSLSLSLSFFLYVFHSVCLSFCLSACQSNIPIFSFESAFSFFIVPYTQILSVRPHLFFESSGHGREQQIISNAQRNVPGQLCYSLIPNR